MNKITFPIETKRFLIQPQNENKLWGEECRIYLKGADKEQVGSLRFEDTIFHGELRISLDMDQVYRKEKDIEEIFFAMARFVFRFRDVKEISTSCRHEDEHYVRALEKAGYVRRETKDGVDYYSMKKQKTGWTGLYIILGMAAGFFIGIVISNLWIGTILGVIIGSIIGIIMDKRVDKEPVRQ